MAVLERSPSKPQGADDFNTYFYQYGLDLVRTIEAYDLQPEMIIGAHAFSEPYEGVHRLYCALSKAGE